MKETLNPLKYLKRFDTIRALLVFRDGSPSRLEKLMVEDGFAKDLAKLKAYGAVAEASFILDEKGNPLYLFDGKTGAPVTLEYGERFTDAFEYTDPITGHRDTLTLDTTPDLLFRAVDRTNIMNMFVRATPYGLLVMTAFAALFAGVTIGLSMG